MTDANKIAFGFHYMPDFTILSIRKPDKPAMDIESATELLINFRPC